jgi:redox-sensing transcriptional repressor
VGRLAPKAVIGRVSLYLRQLEAFQAQGRSTISSSQLGAALGITDAQVRKDLAFFGQFGRPGRGYDIDDLMLALRRILGIDRVWPTAIIGLGNMGQALVGYRGFSSRGFQIVALFDNDPHKIGLRFDHLVVQPIEELATTVSSRGIILGILAVPADAAQRVAEHAVACGIQGLMNFAPLPLSVPDPISVVSVDLSVQLEHLAYKVQNTRSGRAAARSTRLPDRGPGC